jgi:hypothetical protein
MVVLVQILNIHLMQFFRMRNNKNIFCGSFGI